MQRILVTGLLRLLGIKSKSDFFLRYHEAKQACHLDHRERSCLDFGFLYRQRIQLLMCLKVDRQNQTQGFRAT